MVKATEPPNPPGFGLSQVVFDRFDVGFGEVFGGRKAEAS
jgi:hypothetical protein